MKRKLTNKRVLIIGLIVIIIAIVIIMIMISNDKKHSKEDLLVCQINSSYGKTNANIMFKFTKDDNIMKIYQIYEYSTADEEFFDKIKEIVKFMAEQVQTRLDANTDLDSNDVLIETDYKDETATLTVTHIITKENKEAMGNVLDYDYYSSSIDEIYEHLTKEGDLSCEKD